MHTIPDMRIWSIANEYQESSEILVASKKWSACLLASLSLEIYLKSFLSQKVVIQDGDSAFFQVFRKTKRGHELITLFDMIEVEYQDKLIHGYSIINKEQTLKERLERYNNVFFNARYVYEQSPLTYMDSMIIEFAKELREVIQKIAVNT